MHESPSSTMKSLTLLPLLAAVSLFMACSGTDAGQEMAAAAVQRVVNEVPITSGTPVTMADLSIDGMSCEMMCGGSIKKALAQLPGVSATEISFIEGETVDHAIVTYDESQVTDAQMVEAIQKLHDGQYKVMAVTITKQVKAAGGTTDEAVETKAEGGVSVQVPAQALLPGILAILTQILRH